MQLPSVLAQLECTYFYFNLKIGKGDEVIIPSQTHVATAHAVN